MTRLTKQQKDRHEAVLLSHPGVRKLSRSTTVRCEGIKWSQVPRRAVWHPQTHLRMPAEELDPYRCSLRASWHFHKPLERPDDYRSVSAGKYCLHHLYSAGLYGTVPEMDRWDRVIDRFLKREEEQNAALPHQ